MTSPFNTIPDAADRVLMAIGGRVRAVSLTNFYTNFSNTIALGTYPDANDRVMMAIGGQRVPVSRAAFLNWLGSPAKGSVPDADDRVLMSFGDRPMPVTAANFNAWLALYSGGPAATYLPAVSSSPSAVYGSRKMVAAYGGPAYQVQRASDSATMDIAFDANNRADFSAVAAWAGGSTVYFTIRYDQSGNALHETQTVTANKPIYLAGNARDGDHGVVMGTAPTDGGSENRYFDAPVGLAVARTGVTVVSVNAVAGGGGAFGLYGFGTDPTSSNNLSLAYGTDGNKAPLFGRGSAFSTTNTGSPPAGRKMVAAMQSGTGAVKVRINGVSRSNTAYTALALTGGYSGRGSGTIYPNSRNDDYCKSVYPADLSDADALSIETALKTLYNVTYPTQLLTLDGASTMGFSTPYLNTMAKQLQANLAQTWYIPDYGITGNTSAQIYARRATTIAQVNAMYTAIGATGFKIVHVYFGTNTIENAPSGAIVGVADTDWTTNMLPYIQAMVGAGFKLVVSTPTYRGWAGSAQDKLDCQAEWVKYRDYVRNNAVAQGYTVADWSGIALLTTDAVAGTPNPAYYQTDLIHPNVAGYGLISAVSATAVAVANGGTA